MIGKVLKLSIVGLVVGVMALSIYEKNEENSLLKTNISSLKKDIVREKEENSKILEEKQSEFEENTNVLNDEIELLSTEVENLKKKSEQLKEAKRKREEAELIARQEQERVESEAQVAQVANVTSDHQPVPDNWHKQNRRVVESGDDYNTFTGNGYFGAYQFAPVTWNSIAQRHGLDASDFSPANQDLFADIYAKERYGSWSNVPTYGGW